MCSVAMHRIWGRIPSSCNWLKALGYAAFVSTMPHEKRLLLNNEEGLPPCPSYPRQKHEEEPSSLRRVWPFDLSPKKHQLLAQEGILGHQFSFSPSEIHERFELQ
jgi:hypothetical protein